MLAIPSAATAARHGAVRAGLLLFGAVLVLVLALGGCTAAMYNDLVTQKETVAARWSEVENQFQRRYELVPQLVATVQGAADFERSVLTEVTEARASVGRLQITGDALDDPARLEAFMNAQAGLGSALSRLLVTAEAYPSLKASQNFLALQDQLEGTQNRVTVARRDFIDAVRAYNTSIQRVPRKFIASLFGFEKLPQFAVTEEEAKENPPVEFDFGK
jgi:LemA protein